MERDSRAALVPGCRKKNSAIGNRAGKVILQVRQRMVKKFFVSLVFFVK
jgi:hypothetical protein